ncbi:MAG: DUF2314 domain-containing protein [Tepidisphaerales bacterium]
MFVFDGDDAEMLAANEKARATFRYFWRELAWEYRRIVPALDMACVKAAFSDGTHGRQPGKPEIEHMWIRDVVFDGKLIHGVLINSPNWLKSVKAGDPVSVSLADVGDWIYVFCGVVCGAFTVNVIRARMGPTERKEHDKAWGLDFGDPETPRIFPDQEDGSEEIGEHPMSENMGPALKKQLEERPEMLHHKDANGWTLLHHSALAGSQSSVRALLDAGADPKAVTGNGMTALQLAESLDWQDVVKLLNGERR